MIQTIEKKITEGLVVLLALLPLLLKILQDILHIAVPDSEAVLVNLVFLFFCFAGIITWRAEKHLSLASLLEKTSGKVKLVLSKFRSFATLFVLTVLFFDSLCQLVNPAQLANKIWGISLKFVFLFLPLCYASLIFLSCAKKNDRLFSFWGFFAGLFASAGTLGGILYYVLGIESMPFLYALSDFWISATQFLCFPLIIFFIVLAFIGVPLFIVIAGIAYIAFSQAGGYVDVIPLETYRILTDNSVAAIPLFTIAGYLLSKGSAGKRFIELFNALFGWFRGGTVVASVLVMTFFSTFTGVSGVTILALGSLLTIILTGSGYTQDKAESLVTSCGALGLLFPPSVAIIVYATVNYFSVDVMQLFAAAFIPGLLMSCAMIVLGIFFDKRTERPAFSPEKIVLAMKNCIWELILPVCICYGYFSGFLDLFQIAAFAVFYSFCLVCFIRRDFSFSDSMEVLAESVPVSGGVLFILGSAVGLSYFMLDADIPNILAGIITQYVQNKFLFLILMNIMLLVAGCLMDIYSAILIISPLLIPLAESFGISAVQTGVIFLMNLSIGFLTPPVGMDLFIASYTFKKPVGKVIQGILPFLLVQFTVLLLVTYIPWFTGVLVK